MSNYKKKKKTFRFQKFQSFQAIEEWDGGGFQKNIGSSLTSIEIRKFNHTQIRPPKSENSITSKSGPPKFKNSIIPKTDMAIRKNSDHGTPDAQKISH